MMPVQPTFGVWDLLFWIFTGSGLLGLPPGERDAALLKSVPPDTIAYFEWVARGPGQPGVAGADGFVADPEVKQFFELLDASLANQPVAGLPVEQEGLEQLPGVRPLLPQLLRLISAHHGCCFVGGSCRCRAQQRKRYRTTLVELDPLVEFPS